LYKKKEQILLSELSLSENNLFLSFAVFAVGETGIVIRKVTSVVQPYLRKQTGNKSISFSGSEEGYLPFNVTFFF